MLRILLLVAAFTLSGCSSEDLPEPRPDAFSPEVRDNFLGSCVENAAVAAGDAADEEQLRATCVCILAEVEQEYDEAEFAAFEQRLRDESATEAESTRLEQWATTCAEEAAG